ncbi:MAG: thermonuclease family protein [Tannerella sp.]|jgi:endonuclease YncB( thermonuclease family)|nr:thermonuclease family protein [Tannerella sp.]
MSKINILGVFAVFLIFIECQFGSQDYFSGKVIKVIDGDTYDMVADDSEDTIRVRMDGIDAPERGMPFSRVSTNYLSDLCLGQYIEVEKTGTDQYGRTLGFTYLKDGRELGREMLKAGLAWHFTKYNSDQELADLEDEAKQAKRGLWRDPNPVPPWEKRALNRQNVAAKDAFDEDGETLEDKYKNNSLNTGDTPYFEIYGGNEPCTLGGCSQIKVTTPDNSDVLVTIKKDNWVVRHAYIRASSSYTFEVPNGTYQPFFYYGKGWNPEREMKETPKGLVKGGFIVYEEFGKDDPQVLKNNILEYVLILQVNGNFSTKESNMEEAL